MKDWLKLLPRCPICQAEWFTACKRKNPCAAPDYEEVFEEIEMGIDLRVSYLYEEPWRNKANEEKINSLK